MPKCKYLPHFIYVYLVIQEFDIFIFQDFFCKVEV